MLDAALAGTITAVPEEQSYGSTKLHAEIIADITRISPEEWSGVYPQVLESHHFFKTLQESCL